jgi:DNA-binding CsgD family transcriptional regulator
MEPGGSVHSSLALRSGDLATIVDAAMRVDRAMPADVAIGEVLSALAGLVPCDLLFWTRFDVIAPRMLAEIGYPHAPINAPTDEWINHRHEHPICSGLHGPVVSLSSVLSPSQLHASWLYQECLSKSGWEHEIGLNLSHPDGQIHDIVISRQPGRDFDERDRLVLRMLHPHLDAALRRLAFPTPRLTPRETEVMRLVRDGLTNQQIGARLGVAQGTIVKHLEHIFARTGSHTRTQALQLCANVLS